MSRSAAGWDLERLVRPNILRLKPYESAREKVLSGTLLDANELPWSPPPGPLPLNRYPDPRQRMLRERLAAHLGVQPGQVLAGTGSDEVLDWIFKVFCTPGRDRVAIPEPTYGMYQVMAEISGVEVQQMRLDRDFDLDADQLLGALEGDVKTIFLCSPNNPTGNLLDAAQVSRLLEGFSGIVVVDEAYVEFARTESWVGRLGRHPGLVVMRTFSKAWGMAGLRLGYAVASARIISCFEKVKAPYNLNALVQSEACRLLEQDHWVRDSVGRIRAARDALAGALADVPGVEEVRPSEANFLLFRCPDAAGVCRALFERGIVIRDRSSLAGLQDWARVSVGTDEENARFLAALREVLS